MKLRIVNGMVAVLAACSSSVRGGMAPDMLVASRNSHQVLRYDGDTGDFLGVFAEGNGLAFPEEMTLGPDGNLNVVNGAGVSRYDGQTGEFIDLFPTRAAGLRRGRGAGRPLRAPALEAAGPASSW